MYIGFEGKLVKSGQWYAAEVPTLLIFTQGKTQRSAMEMVNAALAEMLASAGVQEFDSKTMRWIDKKSYKFMVYVPVTQPAIAFTLKQIRGYKAMSLAEVAKKMGVSSKNSIAAYERAGGREPTIGKLDEFFKAYDVDAQMQLTA